MGEGAARRSSRPALFCSHALCLRRQYQARSDTVAFRANMMGSVDNILANVPVQHCRNWIEHCGY